MEEAHSMSPVLCKELQAFGPSWPMTIQLCTKYIYMLWNWDRTQDVVRTHQTFETMKETQIRGSFLELGCPRTVVQLNCHPVRLWHIWLEMQSMCFDDSLNVIAILRISNDTGKGVGTKWL